MARQKRSISDIKNDKSTNSSSSNGSNSIKQAKDNRKSFQYWKHVFGFICLSVAITIGYMGYLETRVNTPFDDKKVRFVFNTKVSIKLRAFCSCFSIADVYL